jgi:hypothetical protein
MQRGGFKAMNYTLKDLIRLGWDVRSYQISDGPKWLDSDRYDIEVKPEAPFDVPGPGNEGDHRLRLMVQSMLADAAFWQHPGDCPWVFVDLVHDDNRRQTFLFLEFQPELLIDGIR